LLAAWVAFPLLLGALGYGCGALVERAAGRTLPLAVRMPCGTALIVAVLDLFTRSTSTVGAAIPAVCVLALGGVVLRPPWRTPWGIPCRAQAGWRPLDRNTIAPTLVYAIYAAPIVLSGGATWAGYVKLDDTATWLALVDRTLSAGHTLSGLPTSTYADTLSAYLTGGYPVGSFLPLGLGHALLGQDIAWLTDPWMAFMAAMLAFSLQRIAACSLGAEGPTRTSRGASKDPRAVPAAKPRQPHEWLAGAVAVLGASAALLYGYYLWGGMKEMAGAMLIAAFATTAPLAFEGHGGVRTTHRAGTPGQADSPDRAAILSRLRAAIPALVVVWAMLAALSTGGLVWILPGGAAALVLLALLADRGSHRVPRMGYRSPIGGVRLPPTRTLVRAGAALALVCGLGAYLTLRPGGFFARNESVLTGSGELGNLLAPLHLRQIVGIWTAGDFRVAPDSPLATDLLIVVALLAAAGALIAALRRGRRELALYILCALAGALIVYWIASPWLAGKALATASPTIAFAALVGCAMLFVATGSHRSRTDASSPSGAGPGGHGPAARWEAMLLRHRTAAHMLAGLAGLAIATGILWSDLLGYHDASLAPRAQFAELARIGELVAGQGPTLMTDYSPYGARHFLRDAEAESASELRTRLDPLLSGQPLAKATTADIDQFQLAGLLVYRTLVLRRSPAASRPPSPYRLLRRDRYWEVWQRPAHPSPRVLAHLPLGNAVEPGAAPACAQVLRLARTPGATALAAVAATNPLIVALGQATHPPAWTAQGEHLTLAGAGTARIDVRIPRAGRYAVWLGGSMSGPVTVAVDGMSVGTARYEIQEDAQYVPFGSIGLRKSPSALPARYEITISYNGGDWRPGSGGPPATVGPLVLQPQTPEPQPFAVPLAAARSLCGRTLDWVEALGA
jgi:hypothetical protein